MDANQWNERWPVGARIQVTKADGTLFYTRTASRAERWGGLDHVAVAGMSGYVLLSWCEVLAQLPADAA